MPAPAWSGTSSSTATRATCHPDRTIGLSRFESGVPTWEIDGFRFGIVICADGRLEQTILAMKKAGVDLIPHPHGNYVGSLGRDVENWTRSKPVYLALRALSTRAPILVNNSAGYMVEPKGTRQFGSGALVIDALGPVVQRMVQSDRAERMNVDTALGGLRHASRNVRLRIDRSACRALPVGHVWAVH